MRFAIFSFPDPAEDRSAPFFHVQTTGLPRGRRGAIFAGPWKGARFLVAPGERRAFLKPLGSKRTLPRYTTAFCPEARWERPPVFSCRAAGEAAHRVPGPGTGSTWKEAVTRAPPWGRLTRVRRPPCFSHRERQMYRPKPKCSSPWGEGELSPR